MLLTKEDLTILSQNGWLYKQNNTAFNILDIGQQLGQPIPDKKR